MIEHASDTNIRCIDFGMYGDRAVNYYLTCPNEHTLFISSRTGLGRINCGDITLTSDQTPLTNATDHFLEITNHSVDPSMQGKGFGTKLLSLAKKQAQTRSQCLAIRPFGILDDLITKSAVDHFYKRQGFREITQDEVEFYASQLMRRQQQSMLFSYGFNPTRGKFDFSLGTEFTEDISRVFAEIPPEELHAIYADSMRARFGNLDGYASNLRRFRCRLSPYLIQE